MADERVCPLDVSLVVVWRKLPCALDMRYQKLIYTCKRANSVGKRLGRLDG